MDVVQGERLFGKGFTYSKRVRRIKPKDEEIFVRGNQCQRDPPRVLWDPFLQNPTPALKVHSRLNGLILVRVEVTVVSR